MEIKEQTVIMKWSPPGTDSAAQNPVVYPSLRQPFTLETTSTAGHIPVVFWKAKKNPNPYLIKKILRNWKKKGKKEPSLEFIFVILRDGCG